LWRAFFVALPNVALAASIMPGLVPSIHVFDVDASSKTWMAGTSPAMTRMQWRSEKRLACSIEN
jgi:hypothetical protein